MSGAETAVEVVAVAAHQCMALRTIVPMSELDMGAVFDDFATRLSSYAAQRTLEPAGPAYARYREFGPELADVEIGVPVDADLSELAALQPDSVIGVSELPAGRVARLLHLGPYDQLGSVYRRLESYLAEEGLTAASAPWESYLV